MFKRNLISLTIATLLSVTAQAQTSYVNDLVGLGMAPELAANFNSNFAKLNSTGEVVVLGGESLDADVTAYSSTARAVAYFASDATTGPAINLIGNQAAGGGPELNFLFTKSTALDANTIVANGSTLAAVTFGGADGANFQTAAGIFANVDAAPGANDMPGRLVFYTTPDGSTTLTEALRINSSQNTVAAGTITSSKTTNLGWAVVDGTDNTTCEAQCTSAAVFGLNLAAGATAPVIVGPTDATADICLCAGAS